MFPESTQGGLSRKGDSTNKCNENGKGGKKGRRGKIGKLQGKTRRNDNVPGEGKKKLAVLTPLVWRF